MMNTFMGFARQHGPPGIRNHVLVVPAELSANPWASEVAARIAGCCALSHVNGLGTFGTDIKTFARVMRGVVTHPNVFGVVIIASGNEDYSVARLVNAAKAGGRRAYLVTPKSNARSTTLIDKAVRHAGQLVQQANKQKRTAVAAGRLIIGLNCAGTDNLSAGTSNAVCGAAMDRLVERGATVILAETPELIGLGSALYRRAASPAVRNKLRRVIDHHRRRLTAGGQNVSERELCRFNRQGRVVKLNEKSRISVLKGGATAIKEVVDYGKPPRRTGLVVMDSPAMSDFVIAGLLGAGAQLMVNCIGAGPANRMPFIVGASGPTPIMPVLKISGSASESAWPTNRIDFNAGRPGRLGDNVDTLADRFVALLGRTCTGTSTRTETGREFFINLPIYLPQA